MKTTLADLLATNSSILLDGAMGTMLFDAGLMNGDSPELWNMEQPDKIHAIHRAYIEAGSQVILTNTFGCNTKRLELHGLQDRAAELNRAAAQIARAEADAAFQPVLVAGSMGPTGSVLMPYGDLAYEDAVAAFSEQAAALVEGGVDVLWIETMFALEEVRAALEACKAVAPGVPVVATMTFDTKGRTMMGVTPEQALETLSGLELVAVGANCGNGTDELLAAMKKMSQANGSINAVLVAKSNAGMPHMHDDVAVYDGTPEVMAEYALTVRDLGATLIGACCGSTPDHIRAMAQALGKAVPVA